MTTSVETRLPDAIKLNEIYYSVPNYSVEEYQSIADKNVF
jgi:hypothetical protein